MANIIEELGKLQAESEGYPVPRSAKVRMDIVERARTLRRQGRYTEALQCLKDRGDDSNKTDFRALSEMGLALYAVGQRKEALDNFDQALNILHKDMAAILVSRANVLKSLGFHDDALASAQEARKHDPKNWVPYLAAIAVHADRNSPDDQNAIPAIVEEMNRRCHEAWQADPILARFGTSDADFRALRRSNPDLWRLVFGNQENKS